MELFSYYGLAEMVRPVVRKVINYFMGNMTRTVEEIEDMEEQRIIKTHLPFYMLHPQLLDTSKVTLGEPFATPRAVSPRAVSPRVVSPEQDPKLTRGEFLLQTGRLRGQKPQRCHRVVLLLPQAHGLPAVHGQHRNVRRALHGG